MKAELHTNELPVTFAKFKALVGETHWLKRAADLDSELRGKPFLASLVRQDNAIAYGLRACSKLCERFGHLPAFGEDMRPHLEALTFVAQVVSLVDTAPPEEVRRFIRRVQGAFRNPDDMRGLSLELGIATHFAGRGMRIRWPEMDGAGTMDLLIDGAGCPEFEVECKSIAHDKGRRIHRRDSIEIAHEIAPRLLAWDIPTAVGMSVVMTVPDRLPTNPTARSAISEVLWQALLSGQRERQSEHGSLRVRMFDPGLIQRSADGQPILRKDLLAQITGTRNRESIVVGTHGGAVFIITIQSAKDDNVLGYVHKTLATAAETQLSGRRPGVLVAAFEGLAIDDLKALAHDGGGLLNKAASRLLGSNKRNHVAAIAFVSSSAPIRDRLDSFRLGGSTLTYLNRDSSHWNAALEGLFRLA